MLAAAARGAAAEGDWLVAECQTAGRGRMGRDWVSPVGNCYASTLVRLRAGDPPAPSLALIAGVALYETLATWTSAIVLKWPNDLLSVQRAKLAGILLERADDAVVVGFGVNLVHAPTIAGRATTSLSAMRIAPPEIGDFVLRLSAAMQDWTGRWRNEGLAGIRQAWLARAHVAGTPLTAALPDGAHVEGQFAGLSEDGALQLRLADGALRVIHAGDIILI